MRTGLLILLAAVSVSFAWTEILIDCGYGADNPPVTYEDGWSKLGGITRTGGTDSNTVYTPTSLYDINGDDTFLKITFGSSWVFDSGGQNPHIIKSQGTNWSGSTGESWLSSEAALTCFYSTASADNNIVISGLDDDEIYNIELVTAYNYSSVQDVTISDNNATVNSVDVYNNTKDWLVWGNVKTDGDGNVTIINNNGYSFVNAIRLTPVPEPGAMVLFCLGGLFLRKRK
jgi:hypothetical protein